jgi:glycosyltransferase involved in cell wall biosynthesis
VTRVRSATARLRALAAARVGSRDEGAALLAEARRTLDSGAIPDQWADALVAGTDLADAQWQHGDKKAAAATLAQVLDLAFHRALHFDGLSSPLASDPAGFLAPLRNSAVFQRAQTPRGRHDEAGRDPLQRLLVVSFKNWNFLDRVLARYEAAPGVEVRRLDLADLPPPPLPLSPTQLTRERLLGVADARVRPWAAGIAPHLDWCDTVWVEWGQRAAVLMSLLDPGSTRVVVRLHSYEAFTAFPHLVDWSRVDDLVFVGDQVRAFVEAVVPAASTGPHRHVLPNAMDLRRFAAPKEPAARHVLGLVGWSAVAKDPLWALDVLGQLREHDPRYRLMLVGSALDGSVSAAAASYRDQLDARLARPDVAGAVDLVGQVADVADVLPRIGTILSASVRESFHQGVAEGAASGAVPVVRNWPLFAAYGGARAVFPDAWVVDDVDTAVRRILETTSQDRWTSAGSEASDEAIHRFDWTEVAPAYDRLLRA